MSKIHSLLASSPNQKIVWTLFILLRVFRCMPMWTQSCRFALIRSWQARASLAISGAFDCRPDHQVCVQALKDQSLRGQTNIGKRQSHSHGIGLHAHKLLLLFTKTYRSHYVNIVMIKWVKIKAAVM